MVSREPKFDKKKALETISRGRRTRWWQRTGTPKRGFVYTTWDGKKLSRPDDLDRVGNLVIPPAWTYVRINPSRGGKIQAVGMDTMGRVQYLYHSTHTERQQRKKFAKIEGLGEFIPGLNKALKKHLELEGLPREKVLAVVLRLINLLYFRVGTAHSEQNYKTYGITTLQKKHLNLGPKGRIEFNFVGKSHVFQRKVLVDDTLASILRELSSLGRGRKLFRYLDEAGRPHPILPAQINRYFKELTGPQFSAKDLRTWGGTLLAAIRLAETGPVETEVARKKNIVAAIKKVAEELGNTPAVCRGSYIHPVVIKAYEAGVILEKCPGRNIRRSQNGFELEAKALIQLFQFKKS